ncbi:MAG: hypothetical protein KJ697_04020 [Nanoarchaeota archaeon]|nr:hypothetical protein [Nanoarchaeota archaeon]
MKRIIPFILISILIMPSIAFACEYGSCGVSVDQCGATSCIASGSSFSIHSFTCEGGCCIPHDAIQKCCPATCDAMSTPTNTFYCNPDVGCVNINLKQEISCNPTQSYGSDCCTLQTDGSYKLQPCVGATNDCNDLGSNSCCINAQGFTPKMCGTGLKCCSDSNEVTSGTGMCLTRCGSEIDSSTIIAVIVIAIILGFMIFRQKFSIKVKKVK